MLTKETLNDEDEILIENVDEKIKDKIINNQRIEFEKDISRLKEFKRNKGKVATVFKLKENIVGAKKDVPEAVSYIDPKTKTPVFNHEEILEVAVNYVHDLLTNNEPMNDF